MAAVIVSPDDVALDPSSASLANMPSFVAGEAVVPGAVVTVDPSTREVVLAQATPSPTYVKNIQGLALNGGEDGQPVKIAETGIVTLSATACVVAGVVYCLSPTTPGQLVPHADLSAGQLVQIVGVAISTTQIRLTIFNTGVARGS